MLAVGRAVELGLNVDAWGSGEGEAVADVDIAFRRGCEGWRLCVDGSGAGGFCGGVGDFADGLLQLRFGERLWFGQGCVTLEGQGVDGFAGWVARGDLASGCDLESVFGEARG